MSHIRRRRTTAEALRGRPNKTLPGYPAPEAPIPPDTSLQDIITQYPNHLYGERLLRVNRMFSIAEIARLAPAAGEEQFSVSLLTKRLRVARKMAEDEREAYKKKRKEAIAYAREVERLDMEEKEVERLRRAGYSARASAGEVVVDLEEREEVEEEREEVEEEEVEEEEQIVESVEMEEGDGGRLESEDRAAQPAAKKPRRM